MLAANLISWPIAYYVLSNWLKSFAYHINISIMIFVLSGWMALVIALLTVALLTVSNLISGEDNSPSQHDHNRKEYIYKPGRDCNP